MKEIVQTLIEQALAALFEKEDVNVPIPEVVIERTRDKSHGDFAANIAMRLAGVLKRKPRDIAESLIECLPASDQVEKVEIAGPGFINFFLKEGLAAKVVRVILEQADRFGCGAPDSGDSVQVEFVSANPTGPLHVGHGRGAAYGASLASLLAAAGYRVTREYYVNDAGRQMDILGTSIWLRYLQLSDPDLVFPSNGYKGDYIIDIARELKEEFGDDFRSNTDDVFEGVPADELAGGDKEIHIDALIEKAKSLLNEKYDTVFGKGLSVILGDIRDDLEQFGVIYDEWFSERSLVTSGALEKAIAALEQNGFLYEQGGALWFKSTEFGDEKDRVVRRENGQYTYFASDIAYHLNKVERGFDRIVNVWGSDHHGYVPRVKGALQATGIDPEKLMVSLVQFAILWRGNEKVPMSTRSGEFVTLRELRDEVGNDAARYFYVMRKPEQHLDFDLDLAKEQSKDNPVYYIQYAHARVSQVMRRLAERELSYDQKSGLENLELLTQPLEIDLINQLNKYPDLITSAAQTLEPHQICHYLRELANIFHTYYQQKDESYKIITDDASLRNARLTLSIAVAQVIRNGLAILGVAAPEEM